MSKTNHIKINKNLRKSLNKEINSSPERNVINKDLENIDMDLDNLDISLKIFKKDKKGNHIRDNSKEVVEKVIDLSSDTKKFEKKQNKFPKEDIENIKPNSIGKDSDEQLINELIEEGKSRKIESDNFKITKHNTGLKLSNSKNVLEKQEKIHQMKDGKIKDDKFQDKTKEEKAIEIKGEIANPKSMIEIQKKIENVEKPQPLVKKNQNQGAQNEKDESKKNSLTKATKKNNTANREQTSCIDDNNRIIQINQSKQVNPENNKKFNTKHENSEKIQKDKKEISNEENSCPEEKKIPELKNKDPQLNEKNSENNKTSKNKSLVAPKFKKNSLNNTTNQVQSSISNNDQTLVSMNGIKEEIQKLKDSKKNSTPSLASNTTKNGKKGQKLLPKKVDDKDQTIPKIKSKKNETKKSSNFDYMDEEEQENYNDENISDLFDDDEDYEISDNEGDHSTEYKIIISKSDNQNDSYWKKNIRSSSGSNNKRKLSDVQKTLEDDTKILKKAKNRKALMCSGLRNEDRELLYACVKKFGIFDIENDKENHFTHLIYEGEIRTIKLLYALSKRAWILDKSYLFASIEFGDWVPEKEYELKCYPEKKLRDAAGPLFSNFTFFFHNEEYDNITLYELKKIVTYAGGIITDTIEHANIIVINGKNPIEKDKIASRIALNEPPYLIIYKWILDSVTKYTMLNFKDYFA